MSGFNSALRAVWPLLALMRAIGWFAVERRHDSDFLYQRMRSKIYSFTILSVQIIPAIYIVGLAVQAISKMDPEFYIRAYTLLSFAVVFLQTIPIFASIQSAEHAKFWNHVYSLQIQIKSMFNNKKQLQFNKIRTTIYLTLTVAIMPFLCNLIILPNFLTINWKIYIYISLGLCNVCILDGWWIVVTTLICIFSQQILDDFKFLCNPNESKISAAVVARVALAKRSQWLQLCQLLTYAGDAMSLALTNVMLNVLASLVYNLYQLLSGQNLYASMFFVTIFLVGAANVYIICSWAQYASAKVKSDLLMAMELTRKLKTSLNTQRQMTTFFTLMSDRKIQISLGGYIYLQKSLISSIAYAVITNMLVLYQLHIDERKFEIQEIVNFGNIEF